MTLGERIKKRRNELGITLRNLASKVELSASFISQIEQNKSSPSVENLKKIANILEVKVSTLIEDEDSESDSLITRRNMRKKIESLDSKTKISLLTFQDKSKNMEPLFYEIEPGGESGQNQYKHLGEEFLLVLKGKVDIYIDDEVYLLEKGDSMYFHSTRRHRFKNNYEKNVEIIWVVTPPTF